MIDAVMRSLLNLKVAKDRKGMAPNKPLLVLSLEAWLVGPEVVVHKDTDRRFGAASY